MWKTLVFIAISLCCYAHSKRQTPSPDKDSIRFPVEQDIFFPGFRERDSEKRTPPPHKNWFKIRDFSFDNYDGIPSPKHQPHGPPPRPGEFYPPPPGGPKTHTEKPKQQRRVCEIKYSEYVERIFPNDTEILADANDVDFDGRILARPGEFPHMAAVGFESDSQQIEYKCGGSLISENFVVTAAHCTQINEVTPKWVRIGDLNLKLDEQTVEPQLFEINNIYSHPDYRKELYYNDIALLKLDRNVILSMYVRPIRLWVKQELPTTIAFAMGYGSTAFGKAMTNRLTNLNVTILTNDDCNKDLPAITESPNGVLASQICALDYILNRDTCQGDSGGPLQLNLPGRRRRQNIHYHLIGITSYGIFCRSNYPSVYTRVTSFLDLIESLAWNNNVDT